MFDPSDRFHTDPFVRYHAAMRTSEERAREHKLKVRQRRKGSNACEMRRRSGRRWRVPIHAISQFFQGRLSTEAAERAPPKDLPLPFSVASARLLLDEDKNLFRRADVGDAN